MHDVACATKVVGEGVNAWCQSQGVMEEDDFGHRISLDGQSARQRTTGLDGCRMDSLAAAAACRCFQRAFIDAP
jgi:hypothetical protein